VKDVALAELERFQEFIVERTKSAPTLARVELTKIDVLQRGKHWDSEADLGVLVPRLSAGLGQMPGVLRGVTMQASYDIGEMRFHEKFLGISRREEFDGLRVESRLIANMSSQPIGTVLTEMNTQLNDWFFKVIASAQLSRFGG